MYGRAYSSAGGERIARWPDSGVAIVVGRGKSAAVDQLAVMMEVKQRTAASASSFSATVSA